MNTSDNMNKLNKIIELIQSGKTVCFTTYTRQIVIDKAVLDNFAANNKELFALSGKSLFINGECADGCKITYY